MRTVTIIDEENHAILAEKFGSSFADLGAIEQRRIFKRLRAVLESSNPQYFIYETVEGCDELEVIREGDQLRLYCRLVMGIPQGDKHYNVLFVFYVDKHDYNAGTLARVDTAARQWLEEITDFSAVEDVAEYLEQHDSKTAEYFADRLDE